MRSERDEARADLTKTRDDLSGVRSELDVVKGELIESRELVKSKEAMSMVESQTITTLKDTVESLQAQLEAQTKANERCEFCAFPPNQSCSDLR